MNEFHRGTLAQFQQWQQSCMDSEGIPNGRGTDFYSQVFAQNPIPAPDGSDDYVWRFYKYCDQDLPQLTLTEVNALGWVVIE